MCIFILPDKKVPINECKRKAGYSIFEWGFYSSFADQKMFTDFFQASSIARNSLACMLNKKEEIFHFLCSKRGRLDRNVAIIDIIAAVFLQPCLEKNP